MITHRLDNERSLQLTRPVETVHRRALPNKISQTKWEDLAEEKIRLKSREKMSQSERLKQTQILTEQQGDDSYS